MARFAIWLPPAWIGAMNGQIDLHCHVLPGLDDGPSDVDSAVTLVSGLSRLGFSEIHPTPHQMAGRWTPTAPQREAAADLLRAALARCGCTARIHPPAGENMWDEVFLARQTGNAFPAYVGGKAFLLEFRREQLPPLLPQRLFELRLKGLLPVVAHIERYPELTQDRQRLEQLSGNAALLVNLSSLGGLGNWGYRGLARRLILERIAHGVASDAHGPPDIELCAAGLAWLERRAGKPRTRELLIEAPRMILAGEIPQ